ncbi:MAG: hypothetical protein HOP28_07510 [Gemmatimonadales bacterium]|nr:hypothetical protein [Gemmatimonadales bacterium]
MRKVVRGKLEMAGRVLDFSKARPSDDPGYALVIGRLEERLARARALESVQVRGFKAARDATGRRQTIRRKLHSRLLRCIVALGGAAARSQGGLLPQLRMPQELGGLGAYLARAKQILSDAEASRDLLVSVGLPQTILEETGKLINAFEAETGTVVLARREHMVARADLEQAADDLAESVATLDGLIRFRFGDDPDTMAAWRTIRRLPAKSRPAAAPPAGSEGLPPEPGGGLAPAA